MKKLAWISVYSIFTFLAFNPGSASAFGLKKLDNLPSTHADSKDIRPTMKMESVSKGLLKSGKPTSACTGAETCFDVTTELRPVSDGGFSCATSCNDMNVSEPGDCDMSGASVWFKVITDDQSGSLIIDISSGFSPLISVYRGSSCNNLELVPSTIPCESKNTIKVSSNTNQTFWIKVEAKDGLNLGSFDICVVSFYNAFDCYSANIAQITRPTYPNESPEGPFHPGEVVNFCFNVDFNVSAPPPPDGNNCQWIQGIIPNISGAWDYAGSNLSAQSPAGGWFWLDEGSVDYNVNSNIYTIESVDGRKYMKYGGQNAGMPAGTTLPGGWWFVSNAGSPSCSNDGDPDNMWGKPSSCTAIQNINFCVDLKVKDLADLQDCENQKLDITLAITADGETGCWSDIACSLSTPLIFETGINCSPTPLEVQLSNAMMCEGECVDLVPVITGGSGVYTSFIWSEGANSSTITVCPNANATYQLTVIDSEGNTATASTLVTVNPTPAGALLPNVVSFCTKIINDEHPSLTAYLYKGTAPYQFLWQLPDGLVGNQDSINFSDDSYDIDEATTQGTSFPEPICVTIIDQNGCSNEFCANIRYNGICKDSCYVVVYDTIRTHIVDTSFILVEDTLNIYVLLSSDNGPEESYEIKCYPNPSGGNLYINIGDAIELKGVRASLINESGVEVIGQIISDQLTTLRVANLPKGLYFISFVNDKGITLSTKKIVIK
ncbi:MAG: T9SS type A sorting domain-containing protein [Saprospiraceae bacterium]|nr:T9SS type A sorting domain-containing protein [Saprospiraceae bacterium]